MYQGQSVPICWRLFANYAMAKGNPQIENGHLDLANELVEVLAKTQLSGYEMRILWALWRKTYCWHKKEDWISFSQFREVTKIGNNSHISRTLKRLILRGIVTKNGNKFAFNKYYKEWKELPKLVTGVTKIGRKVTKIGTYKRNYTKETITKDKDRDKSLQPTYGRNDINQVISFLKEKLGGSPDGSIQQNRRFAKLLLDRFKKDYPDKLPEKLVCALITFGIEDDFHGKNITSFKYLYYNVMKIVASIKSKNKSPYYEADLK